MTSAKNQRPSKNIVVNFVIKTNLELRINFRLGYPEGTKLVLHFLLRKSNTFPLLEVLIVKYLTDDLYREALTFRVLTFRRGHFHVPYFTEHS